MSWALLRTALFVIILYVCVAANGQQQKSEEKAAAAHRKLQQHNVRAEVVREVANLASSNLRRQDIVSHVQTHFPDKSRAEANDIVLAATMAAGKPLPKEQDMRAAQANARRQKLIEFNEGKKRIERTKKRLLG